MFAMINYIIIINDESPDVLRLFEVASPVILRWFFVQILRLVVETTYVVCWSNSKLHSWHCLLLKKISTSLHFCCIGFSCQGKIWSAWGANYLPALSYVFSRWQVRRLCHPRVHGGSRLWLGRQEDETGEKSRYGPVKICQNLVGDLEHLLFSHILGITIPID